MVSGISLPQSGNAGIEVCSVGGKCVIAAQDACGGTRVE
jgi:hypothetical protein